MTNPVQPGDVLASKYRIERVLGAGGMGMVVAARHVDLDQLVAIKLLLPEVVAEPEMVERFVREGRASVRLRGVHVAKTMDVGYHDGVPFLVMEYLQGHSLRDELDKFPGGMPIEPAAQFLLHACEGVAEAHSLGIIHRDLKPENLFVSRGVDGHPLVKVLDFGISKIQDDLDQQGALTKTASLFGSPQYMSPEQMRSTKHVDVRTDIWSLGVIGYELLSGKRPFDATTVYELCLQVAQDKPAPLKTLRADAPSMMIGVIEGCLRKDPNDRVQTVAELAKVLEPYAGARAKGSAQRIRDMLQAGRAPSLLPPSADASSANPVHSGWGATERFGKADRQSRRTRWVVGGAVIVSASLIGFRLLQPPPPPVTAELPLSSSAAPPVTAPVREPEPASSWTPVAVASTAASSLSEIEPERLPAHAGGKRTAAAARSAEPTTAATPPVPPPPQPSAAAIPPPVPPPPVPTPKKPQDDFEDNR